MVSYLLGAGPGVASRSRGARVCCCAVTLLNVALCVIYATVFSDYVRVAKARVPGPPKRYLAEHYEHVAAPHSDPGAAAHRAEHIAQIQNLYREQHGESDRGKRAEAGAPRRTAQVPFLELARHVALAARVEGAVAKRTRHEEHTSSLPFVLVPPVMLLNFTLNGTVPLRYEFRDERPPPLLHNARISASDRQETLMATVEQRPHFSRQNLVDVLAEIYTIKDKFDTSKFAELRESGFYYEALFVDVVARRSDLVRGSEALVFGSLLFPSVEVALLAIGGARRVTTVEHRPFLAQDDRIASLRSDVFWASAALSAPQQYDVVVSFGSMQHDGLGRFGDIVDPFGDIAMMGELWALLRPGGHLFLTLPVGNDCLVFNMYRVYGRRRLPLLVWGWRVVEAAGFTAELFEGNHCKQTHQPTLVLQKIGSGLVAGRQDAAASAANVDAAMLGELGKIPGLIGEFPLYSLV